VLVCEGLFWEYVMAVCEFNESDDVCGEGDIGFCVWVGAPITQSVWS
jgi:hypothetical protein